MAEYISREVLLKAIEKLDRLDKETNTQYEYDKEGYILLIQNAPTADVEEVKHGEWVHKTTYGQLDECNCSLCGQLMTTLEGKRTNYCPKCGAKMDGTPKERGGEK